MVYYPAQGQDNEMGMKNQKKISWSQELTKNVVNENDLSNWHKQYKDNFMKPSFQRIPNYP